MKAEHWFLAGGALLGLLGIVAALGSDDYWEKPDFDDSGQFIAQAIGAGGAIGGTQGGLNAPQLPDAPPSAWTQTVAIPGLMPFSRARSQRYGGDVARVIALGTDVGWGQVHVMLNDPVGGVDVSLAPTWYLRQLGCSIMQGDRINGMAFSFDQVGVPGPLYARTIIINGRSCQLRSDEGFALWSNRPR